MTILLIVLTICLALRGAFVAYHFNRLEAMWSDFDRRGLSYRIAWLLSAITLVAYFAAVIGMFWNLPKSDLPWPVRYGAIFIAWLGLALLERFPLHKFPRTNSHALFQEAKLELMVNLIMAFGSAIGMTVLSGAYYWWRG
jgi:hypothetical protein